MSLTMHLSGYGKEYVDIGEINYLNEELSACGLPTYQDKNIKLPNQNELPSLSWKWRHLHHLQFIAIQLADNPNWKPKEYFFTEQKAPASYYEMFYHENKSHLICCGRYFSGGFIPVLFSKNTILKPPFLSRNGSSVSLKDELKIMAYKLGFDLRKYDPDLEPEDDDFLSHEKFLMFQLYNMTLASIKYNLMIELSG